MSVELAERTTLPARFNRVDTINVIGGGPSIAPYADQIRELEGISIGACRAGLLLDCDMTIACDGRFPTQCADEIPPYIDRGGILVHPIRDHVRRRQVEHLDKRILTIGWKRGGFSTSPREVHGLDSGFACFNAAVIYRPRRIRLFGLDYTAPRDAQRWHNGYKNTTVKGYDASLNGWVAQYDRFLNDPISDIEIVNYVGPVESRIRPFLKCPLEELFSCP